MTSPARLPTTDSRIRTKVNAEVQLIMADGTQLTGYVFIGLDERVLDLMNDARPFFPLRLENQDIVIVNKAHVAVLKPIDHPG